MEQEYYDVLAKVRIDRAKELKQQVENARSIANKVSGYIETL